MPPSPDGPRCSISGATSAITFRSLATVPALSATIVLTVGVGLGATVAALVLARTVLVDPLPYADPGRLAWIYTDNPPYRFSFSVVDYRALEARPSDVQRRRGLSEPAGHGGRRRRRGARLGEDGDRDRTFRCWARSRTIGRLFDAVRRCPGRSDRRPDLRLLVPALRPRSVGAGPRDDHRRRARHHRRRAAANVRSARARRRRLLGGALADADAERSVLHEGARPAAPRRVSRRRRPTALRATNARLFPIWRASYQDEKATWGLMDLKTRVVGEVGSTLVFVLAAVACVLLIACANAVNLLIARSLHRGRELAIRGALGATTSRLLQYVLVEACVLTAAAALIGARCRGAGVAAGGCLRRRLRPSHRRGAVLGDGLRLAGRPRGGQRHRHRDRAGLARHPAAGRSGAARGRTIVDGRTGLAARPASAGRGGVRPRHAAARGRRAGPRQPRSAGPRARRRRHDAPADRVGVLAAHGLCDATRIGRRSGSEPWSACPRCPGVQSVALSDSRPPSESGQQNNFDLEDRPTPAGQNQPICPWVGVSPGFFKTRRRDARSAAACSTNGRSRRTPWSSTGRGRRDSSPARTWWAAGSTTAAARPARGRPWSASSAMCAGPASTRPSRTARSIFRSSICRAPSSSCGPPAIRSRSRPSVRQAVKELDPGLALADVATGDDLMAEALATPRYLGVLIALFSGTAFVLSLVGIYGVMAWFVQQHTRDIGIRLAIGGDPAQVRRMVVFQGVRLVGAGIAVGIGAALLASRLMSNVLFGVSPTDPRALVGVPAGAARRGDRRVPDPGPARGRPRPGRGAAGRIGRRACDNRAVLRPGLVVPHTAALALLLAAATGKTCGHAATASGQPGQRRPRAARRLRGRGRARRRGPRAPSRRRRRRHRLRQAARPRPEGPRRAARYVG